MRMYDYLISYNFSDDRYLTPCTGTIELSLKKKIKTFEHVRELNKMISEKVPGSKNLCIYNIILLGRNKH